ncbi:ABC transporter permease [archaeon]|jgi:putative ABC transport system permease protein|nr:ABC transporter permease [archaeon]MBT4242062.1 ABC transporter permease [archaeon]MBT4417750.1 ABC transporter permease [archaeon]
MIQDYFRLGFNNLRRRKLRSWLTMIGIFIGIAAVVSLISLGQGLQTAVTAQFATLSTDKLTIQNAGTGMGPPGSTAVEKLNDDDLKLIENTVGVELVIPRLLRMVKLEYNNAAKFTFATSVLEDKEKADLGYDALAIKTKEGRLIYSGDSGKVVLGQDLVKKSVFDKEVKVGKTIKIQGQEFEVAGILKKSGNFQVNGIVLLMEEDLKNILEIGDEWDLIVAQVEEPKEIKEVAEKIKRNLRRDRDLGEDDDDDFSVETPLEAVGAVTDIINSVNIVVVGIALISLIVGGIGIANTMYTSVIERKKEIGTMKAIGAKNSDVLSIFLIESGLLGLVGGIIGVLIGVGLSFGAASAANSALGIRIISVEVNFLLIISAILFSFLIGIFAGLIPSVQASKLRPVDALRG